VNKKGEWDIICIEFVCDMQALAINLYAIS